MGTRAEGLTKLPSLSNSKYLPASLRKERKPSETATTTGSSQQKLRVRFVLPEQEVEHKTNRNKRFSAVPLPAICEFVIFNDGPNRGKTFAERKEFNAVQKSHLGYSGTPAMAKDILKRHDSFARATHDYKGESDSKTFHMRLAMATAKDREKTDSRRLASTQTTKNCNFSTKELKIEKKYKNPEDFSDPTFFDTKKRIQEWLKYSQTFMPAYRRQVKRVQKYEC